MDASNRFPHGDALLATHGFMPTSVPTLLHMLASPNVLYCTFARTMTRTDLLLFYIVLMRYPNYDRTDDK